MDHSAWAEVDLGAIRQNLTSIKEYVGELVEVMAVVKANAYGHGIAQVATAAWDSGTRWFGVATAAEGVQLHEALPEAEICILEPCLPEMAEQVVSSRLLPLISDLSFARALSDVAVRLNKIQQIHVDVNTGMGRSGFNGDRLQEAVDYVRQLPGLRPTGIATHFPSAESDPSFTRLQITQVVEMARQLGGDLRIHAANSAGLCRYPEARLNMVRPGLLVYGIQPSLTPNLSAQSPFPAVRPALSLRARVTNVNTLPQGASISYDRTCVLRRKSRVATVPVGYGDGYPRELSNKGHALIAGKRARILGRVCMDVIVVDVTDMPAVTVGQNVTLIGEDGVEKIAVNDIASLIRTTPHDVTTRLLPRLPRVYLNEGATAANDPDNESSD